MSYKVLMIAKAASNLIPSHQRLIREWRPSISNSYFDISRKKPELG